MPRYVVVRTFSVAMDDVPAVATRSKKIGLEEYPKIIWEHSHVVLDSDGTPKSFCVYEAPNEEMVREHAARFGGHTIDAIYEIAGDVTPDDFPLVETTA